MLDFVRVFLRIDGGEDDPVLTSLISAAETYLKKSGVPQTEDDLYKLGVCLFVSIQYYGDADGKKERSLNTIILQLKEMGV